MQPFANRLAEETAVWALGVGDGIAHDLKAHLKAREQREAAEQKAAA